MQDHHHMKIDITRSSTPPVDNFRVNAIRSNYDYTVPEVTEHFTGEIVLPDDWQIGVIVGASGTGKTTIARELFGDCFTPLPEHRNPSVIMDMPQGHSVSEITRMFTSLGFSSVPSWLKPYPVLSNGEKMRADLAYTLLSATPDNPVAYDEFTSVVDRDVAHNLCVALHKHIKRTPGLRFIAVTCHSDILDWLQPDWVYSTDDMGDDRPKTFKPAQRRFTVERCDRSEWAKFKRYHYLTGEMNTNARCWEVKYCGKPVGFCAVIIMPRSNGTAMARIHRIVIHPDWQGIGLGRMLATTVAKHVSLQYDCFLQTSNPAMKQALLHYDDWKLVRNNINLFDKKHAAENARKHRYDFSKLSRRVKTASFVIRKHR